MSRINIARRYKARVIRGQRPWGDYRIMTTLAKMSEPYGKIAAISDEMPVGLSFPPHVKGPRDECPVCQDTISDPTVIVIGGCDHQVANYHVLEVDTAGIKPAMTLACQEENCAGRGYCTVKD